jgi:hypothetical protein
MVSLFIPKLSLLLGGFFVSLGKENNEIYYVCTEDYIRLLVKDFMPRLKDNSIEAVIDVMDY